GGAEAEHKDAGGGRGGGAGGGEGRGPRGPALGAGQRPARRHPPGLVPDEQARERFPAVTFFTPLFSFLGRFRARNVNKGGENPPCNPPRHFYNSFVKEAGVAQW